MAGQERPFEEIAKVLVVDDVQHNRTLIRTLLSQFGISSDEANDGQEAIEKASTVNYKLVFMDIQMPRIDGICVTKKLRSDGYKKPIVALTAHAMRGDKEQFLSQAFDAYICKPVDKPTIKNILENYFH